MQVLETTTTMFVKKLEGTEVMTFGKLQGPFI